MLVSAVMGQPQIRTTPVADKIATTLPRREFTTCDERVKKAATHVLKSDISDKAEFVACTGVCSPPCVYLAPTEIPACIAACAALCSKTDGWGY